MLRSTRGDWLRDGTAELSLGHFRMTVDEGRNWVACFYCRACRAEQGKGGLCSPGKGWA